MDTIAVSGELRSVSGEQELKPYNSKELSPLILK